ncbi:hypothetical protein DAEQUDRAFT_764437 [Daedalea quercina L-15889]|uniref:Uncharacterized protein n=1 Tax=Daedalea quercina L-15889 TaxID=1314783 RepID=A0A165RKT7_9APHY|nr:hypothetical protein DAEQUDRAFT_764437 [Daedalea quercina L-15889]
MRLGSTWSAPLYRHKGYLPRETGIDAMDVVAATLRLRNWVLNLRSHLNGGVDEVQFERIEEIMKLAYALPNCDPLVTFDSDTAPIVSRLCELTRGVMAFCSSTPRVSRVSRGALLVPQWFARSLRFGRGSRGLELSQRTQHLLDVLDEELQALVNGLRAQRPEVTSLGSDDVLETEHLLRHSLGLPPAVVFDILEHAEYWIRIVDSSGGGVRFGPLEHGEAVQYFAEATIPESVKDYRPVRRIIFTIEAYETGDADSQQPDEAWWSRWSWFDAMDLSDRYSPRFKGIARNAALTHPVIHLVQWDGSCTDGPSADMELQNWLGPHVRTEMLVVLPFK